MEDAGQLRSQHRKSLNMYNNLYHRITAALDRQVLRFERYLNRLPIRTLWIGSIVCTAVLSLLFASALFASWKRPAPYLTVKTIHVPAHVLDQPGVAQDSLSRRAAAFHFQYLVYELDSLRSHANTKPVYDSLMREHPGLMDSLLQVQQLFLHPYTIIP
jgi:hypothetical protein